MPYTDAKQTYQARSSTTNENRQPLPTNKVVIEKTEMEEKEDGKLREMKKMKKEGEDDDDGDEEDGEEW